jgi:hypothetical protein
VAGPETWVNDLDNDNNHFMFERESFRQRVVEFSKLNTFQEVIEDTPL